MEFVKIWFLKFRKGGRFSWFFGYLIFLFMGSRVNGEMNFSFVLLLKGGGFIYKDVFVVFK